MKRAVIVTLLLLTLCGCEPPNGEAGSRRVAVPADEQIDAGDDSAPRATTMPPKRIATH
ncbi:MAG: hypothetical protein P4L84_17375 [Isosphaeraceae bacterium]|nr:hypothetical protein [Isosphaeraceae bacterium]